MSKENQITLKSYAEKFREYDANSSQNVTGASKDWIDRVLARFAKDARIFEIGTAHARYARYITSKGYSLTCRDAIDEFVEDIRLKGFKVVKFNVLTDKFDQNYDAVIANAVMPHFNEVEFDDVLTKTIDMLNPGGVFAFTIKVGQGSEWHNKKINAPRFFRYWTKRELNDKLIGHGLLEFEITEAQTERAHADWIYLVVEKPNK
ncbi:methyltransferase domain-containing protein [Methylobacterium soli]|uniref:methyltransferase domain-containing protein n=1 Tax=Methylobacterium soli TaxID=553447 RepID=UPI00177CE9D8|nr:methyltransferase domain-containing protein [Methylobacterium soli]GJE40987.1 hypothetical protein AEGHOMDF_0146 [Methylobacterium soli]